MTRTSQSLNGPWNFWTDPDNAYTHDHLPVESLPVLVPAPWQSQHETLRSYMGTGWYQRSFELPQVTGRERLFIHFGAVDYRAEVWLNEIKIGEHENGYLPFDLEATSAARPGANLLTVRVEDPLEIFEEIPHGKQSWYGMISGLWQPVTVETRPAVFIQQVRITAGLDRAEIAVATSAPLSTGDRLRVELIDPDGSAAAQVEEAASSFSIPVANPRLWDVGQPNLYTARITWLDTHGESLDTVEECFGFRTIETRDGQILLNGRPLYMRAALDQDYYPELIYTPPSLDYIKNQFRQALEMGLNTLRVHIKVADPRYYQAADEVGLLIWTELPNWILLSERAKAEGRRTLEGMVARDGNHPSIIIWTIINESWGVDLTNPEHRAWLRDTYNWMKELDPSRLAVGNSACHGNFQVATDIADFHIYYAMPDHAPQFADWVSSYASRPDWIYAHPYPGYTKWREFVIDQWNPDRELPDAPENQKRGDEPLLLSEFGNWGLPDVELLLEGYGGQEPWWFETGYEFGDGIVYPHAVQQRYADLHLNRIFPSMSDFSRAHQRLQFEGMQYEIERIRQQQSIQGYVITEFTDLHWECNGLLDMHRNPKAYYEDMAWLNADDVIIPDWEQERRAFWSGEEFWLRLYLSHYSPTDLRGCALEWSLDGCPTAQGIEVRGRQEGLDLQPYQVQPLGNLRFEIPAVTRPTRACLVLRLLAPDGAEAARSETDLVIFPYQRRLVDGLPVYAPDLVTVLRGMGCRPVSSLADARLAVVTTLTDELRQYLLDGGQVVWLAETAASRQTHIPGIMVVDRAGTPWQGDWASSVGWIYSDRLFRDLPGEGLVDFAFAGLTPEAVIPGAGPRHFAQDVQAGMAVGWLHKAAATIAERRHGRGRLLISTFRLSQNLENNPLAAYLAAEMIRRLAQ